MVEINPPMDHVEMAVSAVAVKFDSVILELGGLLQAERIAKDDAFTRAAAAHDPDKGDDDQGAEFVRIGHEFELHRVAFQKLEAIIKAAGIAHDGVQLARERYRSELRKVELAKLLAVFDDEDTKIKE